MSDVDASEESESEGPDSMDDPIDSPSEGESGLDEEDLRSIEDELFDLEDELIEMQGTTIRTFDESDEQQDLQEIFTFRKFDGDGETEDTESSDEDLDLVDRLEAFRSSMRSMREVRPGQLLAADLRGDKPKFIGGLYTVATPKSDRIFAGRSGQVSWSDDTVHVLPIKRVEGDLDVDERDVRYDGSVLIEGGISDNKVVEATGNIWVMDGVGRSDLKAGGDIIVGQGIKGTEENLVKARGNVYAEFIENATVDAGECIYSEEVIMHSDVTAGDSIYLFGDKGFLVGGEAQAKKCIYADEIGSKNFPETIVRVGASGALQRELEEARRKETELEEQESELAKDVKNLLDRKQEEGGLEPEEDEKLRKLQFELNHVRQDLQESKSRISDIKEELDTSHERRIIVDSQIFPGVILKMGDAYREIEEAHSHTTIQTNDEGEFNFKSFDKPKFDIDLTTGIDPEDADIKEKFDTPPLEQMRKHIIYSEDEPLFDRERQLKRLMDLPTENGIVVLDVTEQEGDDQQETNQDDSRQDDEDGSQDDDQNEEDSEESQTVNRVWWGIEVREDENKRDVKLHFGAKKKDSVKVKCETPEEGVQRAADYFDVEPDELAVKILEEGSSGIMGFGKKKFLIRAVLKSSLETSDESDIEENELVSDAEQEEEVAGFINMENSADGLKLAVYPPEGHGLPVTVEQVEDELEEEGYTKDIDWEKVEELVEAAEGEKEEIGPRQRDPEIDGSFSVEVNDLETEAYLTVYPPKPEGIPVDKEEVLDHLENEGMNYDPERVEELFEEERWEEDVLVAEGTEPDHGDDGSVELNIDLPSEQVSDLLGEEHDPEGQVKETAADNDEQVDHRQGEDVISVKKNEVLVEISPATEGEPGVTIYGEDIPCEAGEDIELEAGDHVRESGDRTQFIAEEDGRVLVKNGKLTVEPVFIVEGDLDYEVGNVEFDGVVVIKGQVKDGFKVEATERIEAEFAGKCKIYSDGDVYLKKGMAGKEEGHIKAGGNVFAKYLENTQVQADGHVKVEQTIMHSHVDAGKNLIIERGRKGAIIGGMTRAGKVISVKKLGSGMAPKTEVKVGIEPKVRDRVAELENEIESQKTKFEKVRLGLQGLNDKIEELGGKEELPEEKQEKHTRLSNVAGAIKHKIESLHSELEDLRGEIQKSKGGKVYVEEDVFPGSTITIQTATMHITEQDNHIRCMLENGEVIRLNYEEPGIELEAPDTIL